MKISKEFLELLSGLGTWAVYVFLLVFFYHFVLKSILETYLKYRLDTDKSRSNSMFETQKDIALKQAEFESIKLQRILPMLEEINSVVTDHRMMFSSYITYVINKAGLPDNFEKDRVELDGRIIEKMSLISIYLPEEFRAVIFQLRKIISCSWKQPDSEYYKVYDYINYECLKNVCMSSLGCYDKVFSCFHDMCGYILTSDSEYKDLSDILEKYGLDSDIWPKNYTPEEHYIWHCIMLHEYSLNEERQDSFEMLSKKYAV